MKQKIKKQKKICQRENLDELYRYLKFDIKSITRVDTGADSTSELFDFQQHYAKAFIYAYVHQLWVKEEYPTKEETNAKFREKINLFTQRYFTKFSSVSKIVEGLLIDAKTFWSQNEAVKDVYREDKKKAEKKLEEVLKKIADKKEKLEKTKGLKTKEKLERELANLKTKKCDLSYEIANLNRIINKGINFGGSNLASYCGKLRYTKDILFNEFADYTDTDFIEEISSIDSMPKTMRDNKRRKRLYMAKCFSEEILDRKQQEYLQNRIRPLFLTGEAHSFGNRNAKFHELSAGKLYVWLNKTLYLIEFNTSKNYKAILQLLTALSASQKSPISIKIDLRESRMNVQLCYDVSLINRYMINEKEIEESLLTIDRNNYKEVYEIYKNNLIEAPKRLKAKHNRCLAIDLNPDTIGIAIVQRTGNVTYKVIYAEELKYPQLIKNLKLKSSDPKSVKQRNKQIYELIEQCHYIQELARNHKCSLFVCEDLSFKVESVKNPNKKKKSKESNRKNNQKWMRSLQDKTHEKLCSEFSIQRMKINPAFTSMCGNIEHEFGDAASAACGIALRGLFPEYEYTFFKLKPNDLSTLEALFPECRDELGTGEVETWKRALEILKQKTGVIEMNRRIRNLNVKVPSHKLRFFSKNSKTTRVVYKINDLSGRERSII